MHGRALIESYIPGNEFAIEGVMTEGVFRPFVIFDKPDPLVGPFFEETIYVTPSRASLSCSRPSWTRSPRRRGRSDFGTGRSTPNAV